MHEETGQSFPTEPEPMPEEQDAAVSKSELKRQAREKLELARNLTSLNPAALAKIPLDDQIRQAIESAQAIHAHGALKRQHQYLAKLLRQRDTQPIQDALSALQNSSSREKANFHLSERWRDLILQDGDSALHQFLSEWPSPERQRLRQLTRLAQKEQSSTQTRKYSRELFRLIRQIVGD